MGDSKGRSEAWAGFVEALRDAREIGFALLDRDVRIISVSGMLARHHRISESDHAGKMLEELAPPELFRQLQGPILQALATGVPIFDVEIERASPSGEVRCWSEHFLPLRENGNVVAVAVLIIDQTLRHRTFAALRKSEEQFRAICETAPIGVFLSDGTGGSAYANQVNLDQMGLTQEESRGRGWEKSVHPDDRERVLGAFHKATLAREPYQGVSRYLHADGRVVYVDVKARGIYDGDKLLGYVGVAEDITERLEADEALRESEMRFRQLAENIDSVFWLSSADHMEILYVSPAFERVWGLPSSTMSNFPEFLETVHPEDRALILQATTQVGFNIEYRIRRPNGEVRWVSDRGFPVRDEAGNIIRQAGITTDITDRKILEAQALQSQKLDSIGRLAGGIAHDFNNLLAVIQGQVASVARDLDAGKSSPEDLRERLREVEQATSHAIDLTRHLLTFARRQELRPAVLDINDVVSAIETLLRRVLGDAVQLTLNLATDLAIVRADPTQVEQVVVNLVANARAAMPEGGKLIIATCNREIDISRAGALGLSSGEYVELSVADTGCGIPESALPHLFDPFFTTRATSGGTGLGLATCYGIVRKSGGAMAVESKVGNGTTFRMLLPRMPVDQRATP